jgi:hypothetical protein
VPPRRNRRDPLPVAAIVVSPDGTGQAVGWKVD